MSMKTRYKIFGAVALGSIVLDQATKIYARGALPGEGIRVPVVDGYFDWVLAYNFGSAFSLFSGGIGSRIFLSIVACIALSVMVWLVRNAKDEHRGMAIALGLMAGGALGNLIDRILFGKVTDMVLWHWKESFHWPVFNVADIALVVAVPMFLLYGYRAEKQLKAEAAEAAGETEAEKPLSAKASVKKPKPSDGMRKKKKKKS